MQAGPLTHADPSANAEITSQAGESRALVALTAQRTDRRIVQSRRHAPFLAHMLAIKDRHPQARLRRRIAPREAIAAYRSAAALTAG